MIPFDAEEKEVSFLRSALTLENPFQPLSEVRDWLAARQSHPGYEIEPVALEALDGWRFEPQSGDLVHASGKFFRIEGLRVRTNFPACRGEWDQPIINQPEIGILGLLTRVVDGVRYFLVQAKMEPGNINRVQLSPTLQATASNFTRVHRGREPRFLGHFVDPEARVLVDQLQSEQGARFLRKRNRNMIVEVDDVAADDDFRWLTLGELKQLLQHDDLVNMDTRTVLSCIPLVGDSVKRFAAERAPDEVADREIFGRRLAGFGRAVFASLAAGPARGAHSSDAIISWFTGLKTRFELDAHYLPLSQAREWRHVDGVIRHDTTDFFSVVGVSVRADDREVASWSQPILKHVGIGLVGYLAQSIGGVLHFLVQAKVEPGIFDVVEMGPTVSVHGIEERRAEHADRVPFFDRFIDPSPERVRLSVVLSEEGGRLYHLRNRYMVVELPEDERLEIPDHFTWMTLDQMMSFVRYNNYFNIEARGLLSCLGLLG